MAAMMAQAAKQRKGKQEDEECIETSGGLQAGQKATIKKKEMPGAQQIGMQAMLLQEAVEKGVKLQKAPKQWGVQQKSLAELQGQK